jgi:hypothetical protein
MLHIRLQVIQFLVYAFVGQETGTAKTLQRAFAAIEHDAQILIVKQQIAVNGMAHLFFFADFIFQIFQFTPTAFHPRFEVFLIDKHSLRF